MLSVVELRSLLGIKEGDIGFAYISPDVAKEVLEKNNVRNRPLRVVKGNALKEQFRRGEYFVSTCCIGFDDKGVLVDGQHRLYAISNQTEGVFKIGVMFGVQHNLDMDTGAKRTLVDNASISSELDERLVGKKVCLDLVKEICTYARGVYSSKNFSQKQQVQIANNLADDLCACFDLGLFHNPRNGTASSPILAAFFLAYVNGVDVQTLLYVKDRLNTSVFNTEYDKPIVGFVKRLAGIKGGGREPGTERFLLACECIHRVSKKGRGERYDSLDKLQKGTWRYTKKDIVQV